MESGPNGSTGTAASRVAGKGNPLVRSLVIATVSPGSVRGSGNNLVDDPVIHGKKLLVHRESLIVYPNDFFLINIFV